MYVVRKLQYTLVSLWIKKYLYLIQSFSQNQELFFLLADILSLCSFLVFISEQQIAVTVVENKFY